MTLRKKDNGKEINVELDQLSGSDQDYVAKQKTASPPISTGRSTSGASSTTTTSKPAKPASIVTKQDCTNTILSEIDNADDRAIVLKWLNYCNNVTYDNVKKIIFCQRKYPDNYIASRSSHVKCSVLFYPREREFYLGISFFTCGSDGLFPESILIVDDSGELCKLSKRELWIHDVAIVAGEVWVREHNTYSVPMDIIAAIAKNDQCMIRINGASGKGYRDIKISAEKAKEFRLFYDACQVLKKYFKEI